MIYRVGLSVNDVSEEELNSRGLSWRKVKPRERVVSLAESLIGVPYKFGSSVLRDSPNSFDCSSLTAYLHVEAGIAIPRICDDQYRSGEIVSEVDAKPGDIVFFKSNRTDISEDKMGHNGLYIGNGEMIHAGGVSMGYGKVVREKIVDSKYYPTGFMGYKRFILNEDERYVIEVPEDRPDLRSAESLINWIKHE